MDELTIYIGNKNYSSWSMRAWLVLAQSGLDFSEVVIPLHESGSHSTVMRYSPSGRVPALHHGTLVIWDSLAIAEYIAELVPRARLWPEHPAGRARARAAACEMHSGFQALRAEMPMNIRRQLSKPDLSPEAWADVARVTGLWRELRRAQETSPDGPFLFGRFTITDAMFAPVVARFRTYGIELDDICRGYGEAVWSLPSVTAWREAARNEPMVIDAFEP